MGSSDQEPYRSSHDVPSPAEEASPRNQSSSSQEATPLSPALARECSLSEDEQSRILRALQDDAESVGGEDSLPNSQERVHVEDLYGVKRWLEELWRDYPEKLGPATALLADASRERKWD